MSKTNDATAFKHSKTDELFNLVKQNDKVIICVGNNKVSRKQFKTYNDAEKYIASKPYEILINVSILIQKLTTNENQNSAKIAEDEQKSSKDK